MEEFLNIPSYIWKGIFSLAKVLGAGLLLAFFATKYQKREEIELQVKANVLKLQLETYVRLNALYAEIQTVIAPPLKMEAFFDSIIDTETMGVKYMEYSSLFDSEEKFDDFYHRIVSINYSDHIYMQYSVSQKLQEFIGYLSEVKLFMDAFCDTEHALYKEDEKIANDHIRLGYQLTGICLQNDLTRFYGQMDQMLAYEVSHISLSYRSHYLKSIKDRLMKPLCEYLERYMDEDNWKGQLAGWFYYHTIFRTYGNSVLLVRMPTITMHLAYIHSSHKVAPEEWYDDQKKVRPYLEEFYNVFTSYLHYG